MAAVLWDAVDKSLWHPREWAPMNPWAQKIASLESWGWSLTGIAKEVGGSPQALSDIKQGRTKEPRGNVGLRLHSLYELESSKAPDRQHAA